MGERVTPDFPLMLACVTFELDVDLAAAQRFLHLSHGCHARVFGAAGKEEQTELLILRKPSGEIPPYCQVVLKVKYKDAVPTNIAYVTHRELK
jgi:hypothetical protein